MDMKKLNFGAVHILIAASDRLATNSLKTFLLNAGFNSIGDVKNLGDIKASLKEENPDLMICECPFPEGDPGGLIHALRHHEVGNNPFLPVIMVTGDPNPGACRQSSRFRSRLSTRQTPNKRRLA